MINSSINTLYYKEKNQKKGYLKKKNFKYEYTKIFVSFIFNYLYYRHYRKDKIINFFKAYRKILYMFYWQDLISFWCRLHTISFIPRLINYKLLFFFCVGLERNIRKAGSKKDTYKYYCKIMNIVRDRPYSTFLIRYFVWRLNVFGLSNKLLLFFLIIFINYKKTFYYKLKKELNKKILESHHFWHNRSRRFKKKKYRLITYICLNIWMIIFI
jgi:hypothetical protein